MTPLYIALTIIILFLAVLRANVVAKEFADWNYYVYRYTNYCAVNYTPEEKHPERVAKNELTRLEAIIVFFSVWKFIPEYFFDFKPDWPEIHEMYYCKR